MKILQLAFLLLITSTPVSALNNWSYMSCRGADTLGNPVTLTANSDSSYVTINGDSLRIVGKTANGQGVVTENFIAVNGMVIYDSIVPYSNTNLYIYQFNAVTQALLAKADLSCLFYGNSTSKQNVMNQPIFKSLKASVK